MKKITILFSFAIFANFNAANALEPVQEGGRQFCSVEQLARNDTANCFYKRSGSVFSYNVYHVPPWTTVTEYIDVTSFNMPGVDAKSTLNYQQDFRNLSNVAVDIVWSAEEKFKHMNGVSASAREVKLRAEFPSAISN